MKRGFALLALVLLATLPFLGGARGGFIEDDLGIIRDRPELRAGGDLASVFADNYWGDVWGGLYRPLTMLSFGLDRMVLGEDGEGGPPAPAGVHATNLLLNAACVLLLHRLLLRLYGARRGGALGAWLGAAVFAVHPAHVEAVVHMVGRADLLAALFFLAAWLVHGAPERARGARTWLGALFYLLSLLSKESGAALPALLACEAALRRPWRGTAELVRDQARALAPYALALGAFVLARGVVLGNEIDPPRAFVLYAPGGYVAFADPAPFEVAWTMLHALGEYLVLLVLPLRLSADYSGFPHATAPTPAALAAGLAVALLAAGVARAARRGDREPLAWALCFLLAFLPISNLVLTSGIVMAERALYLPSIALAGLIAHAVARTSERGRGARAIPAAGAAVVLLLAARSAVRAPVWSDARTLFEATVAHGRHRGHLALTGLVDARLPELQRRPELVAETLERARESVAFHRTAINTAQLAFLLETAGEPAAALEEWARVDADPRRHADARRAAAAIAARAHADPAALRAAIGTASGALARAQGDPARARLWSDVAVLLLEAYVEACAARGDWLGAADGCGMLRSLAPGSAVLRARQRPALEGALRALAAAGRDEEARVLARELLALDPTHAGARAALER